MSYHFSTVKTTGDNIYFPFRISRVYVDANNVVTSNEAFERYIFLSSYSENFEAAWNSPPGAFGQLNPSHKYSQTNRKVEISFKLPARNVLDSKSNLDFCSKMAKLVYGNYSSKFEETTLGSARYNFEGALFNIRVSFGNLIENEFAFFTNFSFTPNFDAGVFEYNNRSVDGELKGVGELQDQLAAQGYGELAEDAHVYHLNMGVVYPKEIEVSLSFTVLHDYPLGWGGPRRPGEALKWAQNENKDWPHGTYENYPKLEYMTKDNALLPSSPQINPNPINTGSYTSTSGSVNYSIGPGGQIIIED